MNTTTTPLTTTLTPPNPWAPPRLSWRWWPVFLRNLLVWRKLALPSLAANVAEPLIWLVAFGYGLGALVGTVNLPAAGGAVAVPYILFLASGSICMSAMNAATFEALYSAFSRMHVQKTWDGIMNAPVRRPLSGDGSLMASQDGGPQQLPERTLSEPAELATPAMGGLVTDICAVPAQVYAGAQRSDYEPWIR